MASVSVVMPCVNHGRVLPMSVGSVLAQSHENLELIVIDDCSCDNSWELLSKYASRDRRVRLIQHSRNQGLSRSRNDGMELATGEFIGFCDSDDIWERNKLETQIALLDQKPYGSLAYSDAPLIDESGCPTGQRFSARFRLPAHPSGRLFAELLRRNFIVVSSVLMRRSIVQRVGFFDESIDWIQDWWYWLRIAREHSFLYCAEPLVRYRVHSGSTCVVHKRAYKREQVKVYHRILRGCEHMSKSTRAEMLYNVGLDLMALEKQRAGRKMLAKAARLCMTNPMGMGRFCKAAFRLASSWARCAGLVDAKWLT